MRSTYYPGVRTKPGTYYQGWFVYMRYTQGQNEEYLLSRSVYQIRYLLSGLVYVHELYTGTARMRPRSTYCQACTHVNASQETSNPSWHQVSKQRKGEFLLQYIAEQCWCKHITNL